MPQFDTNLLQSIISRMEESIEQEQIQQEQQNSRAQQNVNVRQVPFQSISVPHLFTQKSSSVARASFYPCTCTHSNVHT